MSYKHLVVHLDGGERAAERLALAANLASRCGARLTGLFAEGGEVGPGRGRAPEPRNWRGSLARAKAAFDAKVKEAHLKSNWWEVNGGELEIGGVAARYCRYGDLTIVGQHDPKAPRVPHDFAEIVVIESGRPLLVVPWIGHFADVGRRILVAWDGTREASRALNDALPLMIGAEKVQVAELHGQKATRAKELDGPSVVRHLAAHGIAAERERVLVERNSKGTAGNRDVILNLASDLGADLIIMGVRGRSGAPFPRAIGRTRGTLASMTAPVLLSL
jgi:nucleotide-binding universal stress UspA family protein